MPPEYQPLAKYRVAAFLAKPSSQTFGDVLFLVIFLLSSQYFSYSAIL